MSTGGEEPGSGDNVRRVQSSMSSRFKMRDRHFKHDMMRRVSRERDRDMDVETAADSSGSALRSADPPPPYSVATASATAAAAETPAVAASTASSLPSSQAAALLKKPKLEDAGVAAVPAAPAVSASRPVDDVMVMSSAMHMDFGMEDIDYEEEQIDHGDMIMRKMMTRERYHDSGPELRHMMEVERHRHHHAAKAARMMKTADVTADVAPTATTGTAAAGATANAAAAPATTKAKGSGPKTVKEIMMAEEAAQAEREKEKEAPRRRARDTRRMEMHYMMSDFMFHRRSPSPKRHWQLVEDKLRDGVRDKKPGQCREALAEWVKLKDMPDQTQFSLNNYVDRLHDNVDGFGLIKIFQKHVKVPLFKRKDVTQTHYSRTADHTVPKMEFGLNTGRDGGYPETGRERETKTTRSPMMYQAVLNWHADYVRELVDCGVPLTSPYDTDTCSTYLHVACMKPFNEAHLYNTPGSSFQKTVDVLLANGVELDSHDERGLTPLHYCFLVTRIRSDRAYGFTHGQPMADVLIERGADPMRPRRPARIPVVPYARTRSPLHAAVDFANDRFIATALSKHWNKFMPPPAQRVLGPDEVADLMSPTMLAAEAQHLVVVESLILQRVDPVDVQANALELLGAKMSVSRLRTHPDEGQHLLHRHVKRDERSLHAFTHYMRRAARLRAKHGIVAKKPAVAPGVRFSSGVVSEPTTLAEIDALGLSEFDNLLHDSNRHERGLTHAVAAMVHTRLHALRTRWSLYYPNKSLKRAGEYLAAHSDDDFLGCVELGLRLGDVWRKPVMVRFSAIRDILNTAKAIKTVMEQRPMNRECVHVVPRVLDWMAFGAEQCYQSTYAMQRFYDVVNRAMRSTARNWPDMFHGGKTEQLSSYVDDSFTQFAIRCNRTGITPINSLFNRSQYRQSRNSGGMFSYRRIDYVHCFQLDHLALARAWLANGVDYHLRSSGGELPGHICRKELESARHSRLSRDEGLSVSCLETVCEMLRVDEEDEEIGVKEYTAKWRREQDF